MHDRWQRWQLTLLQRLLDYHRQNDSTVKRLVLLAWIAIIGMPLYYLIWARWFPQPYENFWLRLFGLVLCLPAVFAKRFAQQKWLPLYFFIGLTYVLPFFFTFMYLMNEASPVWSQSLLIALIILFHFDTAMAFLSYLTGTIMACLAFLMVHGGTVPFYERALEQWPVQVFAILTVSLAKVGRKVLAQEKLAGMATALATVSHELRTPLMSIAANVRGINRLMHDDAGEAAPERGTMRQALERISFEVRNMNSIISLFLLSASAGNKNLQPNESLSIAELVNAALARYPFVSPEQRGLVAVTVKRDFHVRGQTELGVMILHNLLRNSFKAIHRAGKGRVRIVVDGLRERPGLLFIDTGSGIDAAHLPHIFQRFYAYPRDDGIGIGLAFCKDVLNAWDAEIRCITRVRAYTVFVIEFAPSAMTDMLAVSSSAN